MESIIIITSIYQVEYADDIVLMTPSLKWLQQLIDILGDSMKNISIKVNVKKSMYIV